MRSAIPDQAHGLSPNPWVELVEVAVEDDQIRFAHEYPDQVARRDLRWRKVGDCALTNIPEAKAREHLGGLNGLILALSVAQVLWPELPVAWLRHSDLLGTIDLSPV